MSPEPVFSVTGLSVAARDERAVAAASGMLAKLRGRSVRDEMIEAAWSPLVVDASFHVEPSEVLAIVGESGSGKSLMLMGSVGLLPMGLSATEGETVFMGRTISRSDELGDQFAVLKDPEWRELVGMGIGVLFQDPIGSWNPLELIGDQSGEGIKEHEYLTDEEVTQRVLDALGEVKLPKRRKFLSFPEELSRGEAQRAMLATALLSKPRLLLADEPLTGLDVTVALAVLDLIEDMRRSRGMAMILVTHDLAVVARVAHRVAVVYAGKIVEEASVEAIYKSPRHPYTDGLLGSLPGTAGRLRPIHGDAPALDELPSGCAFHPRCPFAVARCASEIPEPRRVGDSVVRCHLADELELQGVGNGS